MVVRGPYPERGGGVERWVGVLKQVVRLAVLSVLSRSYNCWYTLPIVPCGARQAFQIVLPFPVVNPTPPSPKGWVGYIVFGSGVWGGLWDECLSVTRDIHGLHAISSSCLPFCALWQDIFFGYRCLLVPEWRDVGP